MQKVLSSRIMGIVINVIIEIVCIIGKFSKIMSGELYIIIILYNLSMTNNILIMIIKLC